MSIFVVNTSLLNESDVEKLKVLPDFRKCTRNMLQAFSVVESSLSKLTLEQQDQLKSTNYKNMGLVLGTSLGELEITKDFLVTLQNQGMARPILFQNSLHNATLGFLTLQMKLFGPSVTISERFFTAESALQVAELLLQSGEASLVLVVCTEVLIQEFLPGYSKIYPQGTNLTHGACAFLVANNDGLKELNLTPEFEITSIRCERKVAAPQPLASYYDSNGLEKMCTPSQGELILDKPDGSRAIIQINL